MSWSRWSYHGFRGVVQKANGRWTVLIPKRAKLSFVIVRYVWRGCRLSCCLLSIDYCDRRNNCSLCVFAENRTLLWALIIDWIWWEDWFVALCSHSDSCTAFPHSHTHIQTHRRNGLCCLAVMDDCFINCLRAVRFIQMGHNVCYSVPWVLCSMSAG